MKPLNKSISIVLSVLMILSIVPLTASAATYSGTCGDNVTWVLDASTGMLTISGEGVMYDYGSHNTINKSPFMSYKSIIKNVCIEEGVASVGKNALYDLDDVTSVIIKNDSVIIGESAFSDCDKLISVVIGSNTQGLTGGEIGYGAFSGCDMLSSVIISDGIETIGSRAFNGNDNLENLTIPESVKEIGYLFASYSVVVNYSGTLTELMELKERHFQLRYYTFNCQDKTIYPSGPWGENLTWEINPSDNCLNISGVGEMPDCDEWDGYLHEMYGPLNYYWKDKVNSIVIDDGIETIGSYVFSEYLNLKSVSIAKSVVSIGEGAFRYCSNLTSISIPDSVVTIGERAFTGCSKLESVSIPDSVTTIGYGAFSGCDNLTTITIPDSVTTIGDYAFYDCDSLTNLIIPDNVELIGEYAFSDCDNLTTVTIGDGTISIGDYAFYDCGKLSTIILGDAVETIGKNAFRLCGYYLTVYLRENITTYIPASFPISNRVKIYYSGTEEQWDAIYYQPVYTTLPEVYFNVCNHKYNEVVVPVTCTEHGCLKYTCKYCGVYYYDYTANPTGHSLNEDGVCETCGEKEVSINHINNQMLSIESVFAMVMSFLSKLFGIFSVA